MMTTNRSKRFPRQAEQAEQADAGQVVGSHYAKMSQIFTAGAILGPRLAAHVRSIILGIRRPFVHFFCFFEISLMISTYFSDK